MVHIPVLEKEVLRYLNPKPNENFIDATIGEGGHTIAILKKNFPGGKVLGIERDKELFRTLKKKIAKTLNSDSQTLNRLILVNDSYVNLREIAEKNSFGMVSGILFDLGMSSWHLEKSERGFSFSKNEFLDMRFKTGASDLKAEKVVNTWSRKELEKIFREYGQERFSSRIAGKICEERKKKPIKTTFQLREIIRKSVPFWYQRRKINFATKTFQSLRIAVNDELNNLEKALPQTIKILKKGGGVVIISFHSLEDKIVKNFFKAEARRKRLKILNKKPITPVSEEIKANPRSRSAKLRGAIKI